MSRVAALPFGIGTSLSDIQYPPASTMLKLAPDSCVHEFRLLLPVRVSVGYLAAVPGCIDW